MTTQTQVRSTEEALSVEDTLKLVLEALEGFYDYGYDRLECFEHITAIKEALAQPAVAEQHKHSATHGEPVAWEYKALYIPKPQFDDGMRVTRDLRVAQVNGEPDTIKPLLYTSPYVATPRPQRPSRSDIKPLTIDQIASIAIDRSKPDGIVAFVRAIEAAHGITASEAEDSVRSKT